MRSALGDLVGEFGNCRLLVKTRYTAVLHRRCTGPSRHATTRRRTKPSQTTCGPPRPKGNRGGRCPAIAADKPPDVRATYLGGQSIASLAREHDVSRGAICTAVAAEQAALDQGVSAEC